MRKWRERLFDVVGMSKLTNSSAMNCIAPKCDIENAQSQGRAEKAGNGAIKEDEECAGTPNTFIREAGLEHLKWCQELQQLVYKLMKIVSGAPVRGTEMRTIHVHNSAGSIRNIFVRKGRVLTVTYYHKNRSLMGGQSKAVVRYPDSETSGIIIVYLLLIRPLKKLI